MFRSIKKTLMRIIGAPAAEKSGKKSKTTPPSRKNNPDKQRKNPASRPVKNDAVRQRREPERIKNSRRGPKERPVKEEYIPTPPVIPPKPSELKDVPAAEGKTRFLDMDIHADVQFGIQHAGFEYCTPIQAMTLPHALAGRDIAGKAQTGTGKTAAFLIATFTALLKKPLPKDERRRGCPRALVLAPTRELAIQIHKDAEALAVYTGLKCVVLFGGMDHEKQRMQLNDNIDVVIGTPGRIIDYSRGSSLNLSRVEVLIIDEADRMLDMGFVPDVKRIVAQLPKKGDRQTMLFSATLDDSILRLASGWLVDPVTLESEPEKMVSENIEQLFYTVARDEKLALTLYFIRNCRYERMIIFGNRKDVNLRLQEDLLRYGVNVPILSGDIPQDKRIKILERFRTGAEKIVIATDVAARGIHVDNVSLVINYDLPERAEDYVHRIGRTGRAGNTGQSISFLCEYGAYNLPAIEELLGMTFPSTLPEESMLVLPEQAAVPNSASGSKPRRRSGGHRGGRPGRR